MPLGPMHIAIDAKPYFDINGDNLWNLEPSPSRFIELMIGFPGICLMAASITAGSVESKTRGASISRLRRLTSLVITFISSLSVVATHTSIAVFTSTLVLLQLKSPSISCLRFIFRLSGTLVLSRSPIMRVGDSASSPCFYAELLQNRHSRSNIKALYRMTKEVLNLTEIIKKYYFWCFSSIVCSS